MDSTKHTLYFTRWWTKYDTKISRTVEVIPTGKWTVVNTGGESNLYLGVKVYSVQSEHDIDPFLAHEDDLTLKSVTTNQCNKQEEETKDNAKD